MRMKSLLTVKYHNAENIDCQMSKSLDSLNSFNSLIFLETKDKLPKYHLYAYTSYCKHEIKPVILNPTRDGGSPATNAVSERGLCTF